MFNYFLRHRCLSWRRRYWITRKRLRCTEQSYQRLWVVHIFFLPWCLLLWIFRHNILLNLYLHCARPVFNYLGRTHWHVRIKSCLFAQNLFKSRCDRRLTEVTESFCNRQTRGIPPFSSMSLVLPFVMCFIGTRDTISCHALQNFWSLLRLIGILRLPL